MPELPLASPSAGTHGDAPAELRDFLRQVTQGLRRTPKQLPCKYFYDRRGSQLFDRICELDEYYLTRTELAIMQASAEDMVGALGTPDMLVEYGSGSSVKTRILLAHLPRPLTYVPVDVSRDHLQVTATQLARDIRDITVRPLCADFTRPFRVPGAERAGRVVVYFPGSTIGNFPPQDARKLLASIASQCGPGGGLLIGIDLKKDRKILEAAYNDSEHITAAFNLNLLRRMNRELGSDFELNQFRHRAVFNADAGRIEMYLISCRDQVVSIGEQEFAFAAGERICTEHSHKYDIDQFASMAAEQGLALRQSWTDAQRYFAILMFERSA